MTAEVVVKHFFPKLVELHNYTPTHSRQQKLSNWSTLSRKVFSKLNFHIPEKMVKKIVVSTKIEEKRAGKQLDGTQVGLKCLFKKNLLFPFSVCPNHLMVIEATRTNPATVKKTGIVSPAAALEPNVDPAVRLLLEEKEQAILALQETVEILQIKVKSSLEHLKDLRIEDLTKHLKRYKACSS
uniref:CH-like domain-containing protein n=1 Tax=Sinocyclocheilus anshuiensis TaxID=1608454 RepID=A0A671LHX4_9TELE